MGAELQKATKFDSKSEHTMAPNGVNHKIDLYADCEMKEKATPQQCWPKNILIKRQLVTNR